MSNVIIHVGLPRTGTLFVQSEVLSKSENIFYVGRPYTQEGLAFNMIQYCDDTLYDPEIVQSEISQIKRRADGRKIVISDEQLAGNPELGFRNRSSIARRLQRCFPGAEVVLCLRNQVDIVASLFRKYTEVGEYHKFLGKDFIHSPGKGLSIKEWANGARWDSSRRFVSHRSLMSAEYFKYKALCELYDKLFEKVTILLFEDLVNKSEVFFESWGRISNVKPDIIRSKAKKKVNQSKFKYENKILENRADDLLDGIKFMGSNMFKKILVRFLRLATDENAVRKEEVEKIMRKTGIPEDNTRLSEKGLVNLHRYEEEYMIDN